MIDGWVKLHRQLIEWEWYTDINTSRLFIHLILTVNHKTNKWRGIEIVRGSRLTSLPRLSEETGLSISKIRTSIKKLKSTGDIADKTHAQHTVLYVNNYSQYQCDDRQDSRAVAEQSQTSDRQIASNNKDKNEKNVNNNNASLVLQSFDFFWNCWIDCKKSVSVKNTSSKKITEEKFTKMFSNGYFKKNNEQEFRDEINAMCKYARSGHKIEGFNPFTNMQTGKFLTGQGWK